MYRVSLILPVAISNSIRYNAGKPHEAFMQILNLPFEEPINITVQGKTVQIIAFQTLEHGNIKFGVNAPKSIGVHREEIYEAIKQKLNAQENAGD